MTAATISGNRIAGGEEQYEENRKKYFQSMYVSAVSGNDVGSKYAAGMCDNRKFAGEESSQGVSEIFVGE